MVQPAHSRPVVISRRAALRVVGGLPFVLAAGCGSGGGDNNNGGLNQSSNTYRAAYSFDSSGAVSVVLADGAAYVRRETTITRYDDNGKGKARVVVTDRTMGRVNSGTGDASSFAVSPETGYIYVTSDSRYDSSLPPDNLVQVYDMKSNGIGIFSFGTSAKKEDNSYDSLSHIVLDTAGNPYSLIGNNGFNVQLAKFDLRGNVIAVSDKRELLTQTYTDPTGTERSYFIAPSLSADANGNVYLGGAAIASNLTTGTVTRDASGRILPTVAPDTKGNLFSYVGGAYGTLSKYRTGGNLVTTIKTSTMLINSVVVDAEGRIYFVSESGVQVYEPV